MITVALINYPNKQQNFSFITFFFSGLKLSFPDFADILVTDKHLCFLAGKSHPSLQRGWPGSTGYQISVISSLFATIRDYSPLFATIRRYSPLFALFVLFAIRDYSLFAIRVFQTPRPFCPDNDYPRTEGSTSERNAGQVWRAAVIILWKETVQSESIIFLHFSNHRNDRYENWGFPLI